MSKSGQQHFLIELLRDRGGMLLYLGVLALQRSPSGAAFGHGRRALGLHELGDLGAASPRRPSLSYIARSGTAA